MRKELEQIAEIEKYLEGNMSHSEKKAFEKRLETDPELKNAVTDQQSILEYLEVAHFKTQLQDYHQTYVNNLWWKKLWSGLLGGGLVVVLFIAGIFYFNNNYMENKISENRIETEQPAVQPMVIDSVPPAAGVENSEPAETTKPKINPTPAQPERNSEKEVILNSNIKNEDSPEDFKEKRTIYIGKNQSDTTESRNKGLLKRIKEKPDKSDIRASRKAKKAEKKDWDKPAAQPKQNPSKPPKPELKDKTIIKEAASGVAGKTIQAPPAVEERPLPPATTFPVSARFKEGEKTYYLNVNKTHKKVYMDFAFKLSHGTYNIYITKPDGKEEYILGEWCGICTGVNPKHNPTFEAIPGQWVITVDVKKRHIGQYTLDARSE